MKMRIFTAARFSASPSIRTNGFTLVELLVVVFLIGLAAAAVVLSLPGDEAKLRDDGERLAARIAALRDQAVLESRPMAIWIRPSGYGFERRSGGAWEAAAGKSFAQVNWTNGTRLSGSGATATRQNRLVFDVTGLPSAPARFQLVNDGAALTVNVSAAGSVRVGE
ncbi:GspH/FimT family pseudopilin [Sphingorhabdus arenilitoris]|uniref:Type II secretion system protein H n=1 Tax=Sphingorhabdus arenilitoris TaxID=1490041 RepID=A0ABV8RHG8_9SPHN